ncbi:MAG: phosphoribosyltransferase family protein [Flavobacteriales bacterium]|jgi:pyrimidine operon attenuation protein/uracil phosphoribosyltransferase|tara:strand:- start:432 stop:929 length:498 start_codon:yes stop_codon:yes gene_type:complete
MSTKTTQILNAQEIQHKIQRLAWELYDRHSKAEKLYVVGIQENGYWLAEQLVEKLSAISSIEVELVPLVMHKKAPVLNDMHISLPEQAEIALVDDVLNSGRTLLWAVIKLMEFRPQQLSTTVLVDRSHKRYPVKADLKGISLSTTLQETVRLNIENGLAVNVYLV